MRIHVSKDLELGTFADRFLNPEDEESRDHMISVLESPSKDPQEIRSWQDAVRELYEGDLLREAYNNALESILDLREARETRLFNTRSSIKKEMNKLSGYCEAVRNLASADPDAKELTRVTDLAVVL